MNTPKYYIGQKVMWDGKEDTISTILYIKFDEVLGTYLYIVDRYREGVWYEEFTEDYLQRPPAKLEFGYCAVGDVITDGCGYIAIILDVKQELFAKTCWDSVLDKCTDFGNYYTYVEAKEDGWRIAKEKSIDEELDEILGGGKEIVGVPYDPIKAIDSLISDAENLKKYLI